MVKKVAATASDLSVQTAMAEIAQTDPEIKKRIRGILSALLNDIEFQLKYGSPSERAALARSVIPSMMKSLAGGETGDKETQDAVNSIMAMLRGDSEAADG